MNTLRDGLALMHDAAAVPLAELDLRTLEGLLVLGTLVIVIALFLIALTRRKTPAKTP